MLETTLTNPWFWAFLGMFGWSLGFGVVGTKGLGQRLGYGVGMFILAEVPRIVLPLPFVLQPRIGSDHLPLAWIGAIILVGSMVFGTPVFRIVPLTGPDGREPLRTGGLYSITRHPLMLCDIFWPLGWSLIFGSIIGVALIPIWLVVIWALTQVEEEALVREYQERYREYQKRVPRLFPRFHLRKIG